MLAERLAMNASMIKMQRVGGDSINDMHRITLPGKQLFCKVNSSTKFPSLFLKEKKGLEWLHHTATIQVPKVIDCFETNNRQVFLLEWIEEGLRKETFRKGFGGS